MVHDELSCIITEEPGSPYFSLHFITVFLFDNANCMALFSFGFHKIVYSGFTLLSHFLLSLIAPLLAPQNRFLSLGPYFSFYFLNKDF